MEGSRLVLSMTLLYPIKGSFLEAVRGCRIVARGATCFVKGGRRVGTCTPM